MNNKITALLEQLTEDKDLSRKVVNLLEQWKRDQKQALKEDIKRKFDTAIKVCEEEVDNYKKEISKKVEIFLESHVAAVERSARDRKAIEESKAVNDLKRVKNILEGISHDGSNGDLQAYIKQNEELRKSLAVVTEQKAEFVKRYNRTKNIATNAIERNKILEGKIKKGKSLTESKSRKQKQPAKLRLVKGKAKTTKGSTITESQVRGKRKGNSEIQKIANSIDEYIA